MSEKVYRNLEQRGLSLLRRGEPSLVVGRVWVDLVDEIICISVLKF